MSIENSEEEKIEETTEEEETETIEQEEQVENKKPIETLEARKSRLERQLAQTNKKLGFDGEVVTQKENNPSKKSDGELDYGQKAYLTANGIKGAKEFEFVKKELKSSGYDLDGLLENDYFKSKLENFRALSKTAEATPTGKRSNGVATDSVEYWMTKPLEEVPKDMRIKVVNAQIAKEKNKGQFYNS